MAHRSELRSRAVRFFPISQITSNRIDQARPEEMSAMIDNTSNQQHQSYHHHAKSKRLKTYRERIKRDVSYVDVTGRPALVRLDCPVVLLVLPSTSKINVRSSTCPRLVFAKLTNPQKASVLSETVCKLTFLAPSKKSQQDTESGRTPITRVV